MRQASTLTLRRAIVDACLFCVFFFFLPSQVLSERLDGRYSFSLTTFDPDGKLGQVERANRAAALGTPVVAVKCRNGILFGAPQALPSPLVRDDGTARFSRITRNIAVTHSGLGADGRVVVAAAQRMAVEHAYTFDEAIPIELFLEEVSLLFQEYTMKPATRPFGCTLLVAYVPDADEVEQGDQPELYRVDPSGSVEYIQSVSVIGSLVSGELITSLEEIAEQLKTNNLEEGRVKLVDQLRSHIHKSSSAHARRPNSKVSFLTATLTKAGGLVVKRHAVATNKLP